MKKLGKQIIQKTVEIEVDKLVTDEVNQGLEALLGKNVILLCMNYFYAGMLVGVNEKDVILENAGIVYETGPLTATSFKDFQRFPVAQWRVRTDAIESYGEALQLNSNK